MAPRFSVAETAQLSQYECKLRQFKEGNLNVPPQFCGPWFMYKLLVLFAVVFVQFSSIPFEVLSNIRIVKEVHCPIPNGSVVNL